MDVHFTSLKLLLTTIISFMVSYMGGSDNILDLLVFLMIIDVFTGIAKGFSNHNLSADKIFDGGIRKIICLIIIAVAYRLEMGFGTDLNMREITITFYIMQEGLSIVENVSIFTPIPEVITKFLAKQDTK